MRTYACFLSLLLAPVQLTAAYTYWLTDYFGSINTTTWQGNGNAVGGASGLYASGNTDGSAILKTAVPDSSSDYEVRAQLTLASGGGSYLLFLRATQDARIDAASGLPVGSFIAFEVLNPTFTNGNCTATVTAWRGHGGTTDAPGFDLRAVFEWHGGAGGGAGERLGAAFPQ